MAAKLTTDEKWALFTSPKQGIGQAVMARKAISFFIPSMTNLLPSITTAFIVGGVTAPFLMYADCC